MNRTDRLLAIVLEIQARRYTRGEDLAEQFEVSVRTIYRDVLALCEAGVPVISTPGYGYSMAPGYFLPPLMLTADEAGMLLLGAAYVAAHIDAPYKASVEVGRKKIEKLLPEGTRREVEFLQDSLRFVGPIRRAEATTNGLMEPIRRAISEREVLHISYYARHGEPGTRDVEPHGLVYIGSSWVMTAYCRSRKDMRNFRLDRIDRLEPTGEQFVRRTDYTVRRIQPIVLGAIEVRILFSAEASRWAREDLPFGFVGEEQHPEGTLLTFRPRNVADLIPWLLSWGEGATVLSPPDLRQQIRATAHAIVARYGEEVK